MSGKINPVPIFPEDSLCLQAGPKFLNGLRAKFKIILHR
jgi:hypothetical protein